jgi:hypothetical protein
MNKLLALLLLLLLASCGHKESLPVQDQQPPMCETICGDELPCYLMAPKYHYKISVSKVSVQPELKRKARNVLFSYLKVQATKLHPIYEKYGRSEGILNGEISFRAALLPNGAIDSGSVVILESSMQNPEFDEEIRKKIGSFLWRRSHATQQRPVIGATLQFSMQPQEQELPWRPQPLFPKLLLKSRYDYNYAYPDPRQKPKAKPAPDTTKIRSLFAVFRQNHYIHGEKAKGELESFQGEIIPQLLALLNDSSFERMDNTLDLLYPGAGVVNAWHGGRLDYAIDYAAVRAGWLLEDLTFQNFGYTTFEVPAQSYSLSDLLGNILGCVDRPKSKESLLREDTVWMRAKQREQRNQFAQTAREWWQNTPKPWRRTEAIKEALQSDDVRRQNAALNYLWEGKTKCDGLTPVVYEAEIKPLVRQIFYAPLDWRVERAAKNLLQHGPSPALLSTERFDW